MRKNEVIGKSGYQEAAIRIAVNQGFTIRHFVVLPPRALSTQREEDYNTNMVFSAFSAISAVNKKCKTNPIVGGHK